MAGALGYGVSALLTGSTVFTGVVAVLAVERRPALTLVTRLDCAAAPAEAATGAATSAAPFAPQFCSVESGTVSLLTRKMRVVVSPRLEPLIEAALAIEFIARSSG